ncbi:NUDIX domain-containing protein [Marimonas sp. MJW-29]|uniref:ADP-ribose pyrophosphatase n=1 Tax=Sulfitobacter sediminis TaxID=3234186 RepID=A0ABV3RIN7_9RHOB
MKNLFFYGTLRHMPLLEVVLGRDAADLDFSDADLPDCAVSAVAEGPFPMISDSAGQSARGVLVRGLSSDDIARLDFYEGSFAYDLRKAILDNGEAAEVYFPQPGLWTADGPWSLADWVRDWGEMSVIAAREVMGYKGSRSRDEVAAMFPVIRARASSRVRAKSSLHGADTFEGRVQVHARERPYSQFFAVDDYRISHEKYDGSMSEVLDRAVFVAADAALVLPYDPLRDRVLLVEQIRLGPLGRGDRTLWQFEPIAGRIDPGETPEQTARREAMEEADIEIGALEKIAEIYPSPGTSSEFYYLYLGRADLSDDITGTSGLEAEHENIRSHLVSFADLMDRIGRFDVANAPLALAAYYLATHRDRLRSEWADATPD